jgi:hypothetical protein
MERAMTLESSSRNASIVCTTASVLLGLVSIQLAKRMDFLDHLRMFNLLAAAMLGLVIVGLATAIIPLSKARGRSASLWLAVVFAVSVLGLLLLDG